MACIRALVAMAIALCVAGSVQAQDRARPNVVLIVCDDLNDWIEPLGGHPQAKTPAMAAFAQTAVTFVSAHSNNPVCAPSRSSMLIGIYPHTSGNLFFDKWYENPVLAGSHTLMEHFGTHGYRVVGAGKLMHHARRSLWDRYGRGSDLGPFAYDGEKRVGHPSVREPFRSIGAIDGSFGPLSDVPYANDPPHPEAGWIRGKWGAAERFRYISPQQRERLPDEAIAHWAASQLEGFAQDASTPFFLAVGFLRPHTPLYAPQRHFEMFPLEEVELPAMLAGDASDTHFAAHFSMNQKGRRYHRLISEAYGTEADGLKRFTQAYLACTAFVDEQVGVVLDAIDRAGLRESTIVIITSDHGFNIGPKSYLFKNALWETSTRVPLLIRSPGVSAPGQQTTTPVSLIDLYPTLVDLCGLSSETMKSSAGRPLDGHSLRPLLEDPTSGHWNGPPAALSMVHAEEDGVLEISKRVDDPAAQHWTVRTAEHRYVRYNSGAIELYDHRIDPHEWNNLAHDPSQNPTIERLDSILREMIAPVELRPIKTYR